MSEFVRGLINLSLDAEQERVKFVFMARFLSLFLILISAVTGAPVISEFLASNATILADEDGDFTDWIEITNPTNEALDLTGYHLTDDPAELTKWTFPSLSLPPEGVIVVFASGKDRLDPTVTLHTNFKLSASGEYLALVASDGTTIASEFAPTFPRQITDQTYGVGEFGEGFFDTPTPGEANSTGRLPGPVFGEVMEGSPQPLVGSSLEITAEVRDAEDVTLFYRIGEGSEQALAMTSDGNDTYRASITVGQAGERVRWKFVAQDTDGRLTREPPFRSPEDSAEYYGTAVTDTRVESLLPVFQWFIPQSSYNRLINFQIVKGAIFYGGEYYDNVTFSPHGQSTLFFAKKSFNIDFNKEHRFRWREGEKRAKDIDLLTNWADKSKSRQPLAYQLLRDAGVPTHFAFQVRVQQNGDFFSVADLVEDADERYLERAGLNPEGALYKPFDNGLMLSDIGSQEDGVTKKNRKEEDNSDLHALIRGLNLTGADRWDYIYDNIDLPTTINTLAGLTAIMQTDMFTKNYYLYRDTDGTNEWSILPWDLDLTFGRDFRALTGYFDTNLFSQGNTAFQQTGDNIVLVDQLLNGNPNTKAMFHRRVRTLADQYLRGTYLSDRLDEYLAAIDPPSISPSDALRDFQTWGTWVNGSPVPRVWNINDPAAETMLEAVNRLRFEWLPARIIELYDNNPDLPPAQETPAIMFGALDFDPESDDQEQEFIELLNQEPLAADLSGWRVTGGVNFTLPPGTVIPAGGSLYLSPDVTRFRTREISPTGGEQRFVVGPYQGNLSGDGETLDLLDLDGNIRDSKTFSGNGEGFDGNGRLDVDGDGLSAFLEYAIGTSDQEVTALTPPSENTFRYTQRSDLRNATVQVEISIDLIDWTTEGVSEISRVPGEDGLDQIEVSLPPTSEKCFTRLILVRP